MEAWMSFVEIRFPEDISYGSSGGPGYATDVVSTESGHEQRNVNWQEARARYNVAHGVKTQAQLDTLIAFFRARKGRAYGFRFKDWGDFSATGQLLGTGNGAATQFQLVKRYTSGGVTETRRITKPVAGSVTLYLNAAPLTSGVSVSTTTGIVTLTAPPANGVAVTANFEFDVPVRFDTDQLSASLDAYGVHSWPEIPLVELRI
jgi:uncharacterized protein (TIGR02217 family)